MLVAERIRQIAEAELGVAESGGPNNGPRVREFQSAVVPLPLPVGTKDYAWCAAFCVWVYREAGIDGQWITASTHLSCVNAAARGFVSSEPRMGALLCWCGTHVGILIEPVGPDLWRTVEGNSADQVRFQTRSLKKDSPRILVASELAGEAPATDARRRYWIQDRHPSANPEWIGPWLNKAVRDRKLGEFQQVLGRKMRAASFFGKVDPETGLLVATPDPMGPTKGDEDDMIGVPELAVDALPSEPTDVPSGRDSG